MIFFQSPVWRHIQELVGRKTFDIDCGDRTYRGVTRSHAVGPCVFSWHQVLGVDNLEDIPVIEKIIHERFSQWGDVFFQVGVTKTLVDFDIQNKKDYSASYVQDLRTRAVDDLVHAGWRESRKENMPLATITTPLHDSDTLYASYHKEHRRSIRKARTHDFELVDASQKDLWKAFYAMRSDMGATKGIGIMSWESFALMMQYLYAEDVGHLFLLMDGDVVMAGTVLSTWDNGLFYLYGGSNRDYHGNGAHVMLQHEVMSRGYQSGYKFFDHRGVASRAYPNHPLTGVTRFKERFGGRSIEYLGNIDYVTNSLAYRLMKWRSQ